MNDFFKLKISIVLVSLFLFGNKNIIQPPILIGPENIFEKTILDSYDSNKKRSPQPSFWGGKSLTQKEKNIQGVDFTVYILGGGAWIRQKNLKLSANEIEILGDDAIRADLKGRVVVEDFENNSILSAKNGYYDKLSDKIYLEGNPQMVQTSKEGKKTYISAEKIIRFIEERKTILQGKVYLNNVDFSLVGEDAEYLDSTKQLVLSNHPFLFGNQRFLSAKKFIYDTNAREVSLDGDAFLVQKNLEKKEGEEEPVPITTYAYGEKLIRKESDEEGAITSLLGNAKILRPDMEFYAESIKNYYRVSKLGIKEEIIEASKNINFINLENNFIIKGEYLQHFPDKDYSYITNKPMIELKNKDNETTGYIYAVVFERFGDKKEIVARGNVFIDSSSSKARGEYATYYEEEKKIILEGDPTIERDGKLLHSGKIVIYPYEDRVILSEGLNLQGEK